ncbi:MAG: TetR/AcrR family transcriptional regulator [Ketobacteraceae bacterium]|nr:TetR/AcrR family transcriptional regulator [Ketobacteraceae bacterium]
MMSKGEQTRARVLQTTLDLMERQGFHNTGLQQIIKESGTPKGSLYFHFPEGKDQIAALALAQGAAIIQGLIEQAFAASRSPRQAMDMVVKGLTVRLVESDFCKGCPVATVALEIGDQHPLVKQACEAAYSHWLTVIANGLKAFGMSAAKARKEATLLLSGLEGALILAKVQRDTAPLKQVADAMMERLSE